MSMQVRMFVGGAQGLVSPHANGGCKVKLSFYVTYQNQAKSDESFHDQMMSNLRNFVQ